MKNIKFQHLLAAIGASLIIGFANGFVAGAIYALTHHFK